jgi:anti-sigma factor RsiW
MTENEHPKEPLEAFLAGQLSEEENEIILSHLAECDHCLTEVDRLWEGQLRDGSRDQIPELEADIAERVERSVIRRINRTDSAGSPLTPHSPASMATSSSPEAGTSAPLVR